MRRKHPHIGFASLLASSASSYCRTLQRTRPDCRYDVHRKCFRLWAALCSLPATLSPADIRNCYSNGDRYRRYRIMVTSPLEVHPRGPRRAVTDRIRAPPADHLGKGRTVLTRTLYWFQHEPAWFVRKKNAPWYGKAGENSTIWASPSPKFIMGGSDEEKYDHPARCRGPIQKEAVRGPANRYRGIVGA
jgi:hypothetical protein